MSIYDLVVWGYYALHAQRSPDPARYVLTQPGWLSPRATVLDYGGGEGRWAAELAERAGIVAVADIDERALKRVPSHPRLRPVLIDGVTLPFRSGIFDLVFVNHVLHHVEDLPRVLAELSRVVRRDGRLTLIEFDPRASVTRIYRFLSRYRMHPCTFYAPRDLARLLRRRALTVDHQRLDEFQYVIMASLPASDPAASALQPR